MHKRLIDLWSFILVLSLILASVANAGGKPNLIGWWKFDGDTLDSSGLCNDGIADDVTSNNITLSGWVKTTDLYGLWLSSNGAPGGNVNKALWGIDNGQATIYDGANRAFEGYSITNVSDVVQHMLTYVGKGSTGYEYVDGLLENIHTADWDFSSTDRWSIGQEWDDLTPSDFLTGSVDDVRIYDRTLWEAQIQDLFNGIAPTFVTAENPEPADGTMHLDTWVTLFWEPGGYAVSHDVYFGEKFDPG